MKQKFNLEISNPCSEKFNKFKQTKSGGFCNSCSKEVIDFRNMTDAEVFEYFKINKETTCGNFNKSQLKMYTQKTNFEKRQGFNMLWAAAGFSLVFMLSTNTVNAQDNKNPIEVTEKTQSKEQDVAVVEGPKIKGTVLDEAGYPIPGVNIMIRGTAIGAQTDFDGRFELNLLSEKDILILSYIGYKTQEIAVKNNLPFKNFNITMQEDYMELMGKVQVAGEVHKTKRSFWQKVKDVF